MQCRGNDAGQDLKQKLGKPVHHIHGGKRPEGELPVTFGLLLNLVGVMGDSSKAQVWGYLSNYVADASAETYPELDKLIERSASATPPRPDAMSHGRPTEFVDSDYPHDRSRNTGRKKSWLSDIFD